MKIVVMISRILLGIMFTVFGLNGFLHFIPQPAMPPSLARDYFVVLMTSHYFVVPFAVQLFCGILFLINRFVPLALVFIAPVLVNILTFHILMQPQGLPPGTVATILWFIVAFSIRSSFDGILSQRGAP